MLTTASLLCTSNQILLPLSVGDKGLNHFRNTLADAHSFQLKAPHGIWWKKSSLVTVGTLLSYLNRYASYPTRCFSWDFPHSSLLAIIEGIPQLLRNSANREKKKIVEKTFMVNFQMKSDSLRLCSLIIWHG